MQRQKGSKFLLLALKVFHMCVDKEVQGLQWINSLLSLHRKYSKGLIWLNPFIPPQR